MKKPIISFDEFTKLDFRVGTVISCEKIEKSNKLLRIIIDIGEELGVKQIISGIAGFYTPEELIGKQIVVLVNLEPRKFMGLESQGMIIAAGEKEAILLSPDKKINNGEIVR